MSIISIKHNKYIKNFIQNSLQIFVYIYLFNFRSFIKLSNPILNPTYAEMLLKIAYFKVLLDFDKKKIYLSNQFIKVFGILL